MKLKLTDQKQQAIGCGFCESEHLANDERSFLSELTQVLKMLQKTCQYWKKLTFCVGLLSVSYRKRSISHWSELSSNLYIDVWSARSNKIQEINTSGSSDLFIINTIKVWNEISLPKRSKWTLNTMVWYRESYFSSWAQRAVHVHGRFGLITSGALRKTNRRSRLGFELPEDVKKVIALVPFTRRTGSHTYKKNIFIVRKMRPKKLIEFGCKGNRETCFFSAIY